MEESDAGIAEESKALYQTLLASEQALPLDTLFRDDIFRKTCRKLEDRNETRVIRDIAQLIVPSAESLATFSAAHLINNVNEGWNESIPFAGPRPQPDYSVGFKPLAFTEDQRKRLKPFIGDLIDTSLFVATWRMWFPFLTCEVKCGAGALDVADRQNAHSATLAVRGVVELFRAVKQEKQLHREILAFSVSHDHRLVRIYGHYPVIEVDVGWVWTACGSAGRKVGLLKRDWAGRLNGGKRECYLTPNEPQKSEATCDWLNQWDLARKISTSRGNAFEHHRKLRGASR